MSSLTGAVSTDVWSPAGAAVGLLGGLGLLLIVYGIPAWRRPTLHERIAPYLPEVTSSRLLGPERSGSGTFGTLERLLAPVMADAVRAVDRFTGSVGGVRRKLDQLGQQSTIEQFRTEQVVWGAAGALAGLLLTAVGLAGRGLSAAPSVALIGIGAAIGVVGREQHLGAQVRRRQSRMLAEFPTIAELLALSVGAGEGAVGALDRVARTCRGELAAELRRTLADARAGASLIQSLEGMAARTSLPSLSRFVDGMAVAVDRGTPLADVLRAQAQDVRESSRRSLMDAGGKKEIAMMLPVVFLVLPVTVLFVVYPGIAALDLNL